MRYENNTTVLIVFSSLTSQCILKCRIFFLALALSAVTLPLVLLSFTTTCCYHNNPQNLFLNIVCQDVLLLLKQCFLFNLKANTSHSRIFMNTIDRYQFYMQFFR